MIVTGVDVSRAQRPSECSWRETAALSFVYVKTTEGRRDGAPFVDDACIEHLSGIREAGLIYGVYHVARLDNRENEGMDPDAAGSAEADFAVETARGLGAIEGCLPIALDLEKFGSWSFDENGDFVGAFCERVLGLTGRACAVYVGPKVYNRNFDSSLALALHEHGCPLWLARPDGVDVTQPSDLIDGWPWAIWQKSHTATWPGLPTPIDLNEYRGTMAELRACCAPLLGGGEFLGTSYVRQQCLR